MKALLFIILSVFLLFSCARNYQKEIEDKIEILEKEGKSVIEYSLENHFIIYKYGTSFWLDNLDDSAKSILSADKDMKLFYYSMEWNNVGEPSISIQFQPYYTVELDKNYWLGNEKENETDYVYPFNSSNFDLVKSDSAVILAYKYNSLDRGGTPVTYTSKYFYSLSKPNVLFSLSDDVTYDSSSDCIYSTVFSSPVDLAEKLLPSSYDTYYPYIQNPYTSGNFEWTFRIDGLGNIENKSYDILYKNETYGQEITFHINDFSSKEMALKVLQTINDTIQNAEKEKFINDIKKKTIDISDISECYHNELKAEKDFVGKKFLLQCEIDKIEEADGLFDLSGYKYKIKSYSTELFGEWMSGYDIVGYTNDDNFIDLSCPNTIIMECVLVSGSVRRFQFKDCNLILSSKK